MTQQSDPLGITHVDLADWRLLLGALRARYETESFSTAAAFVAGIAQLAEQTTHNPDIDLRTRHVQLVLSSPEAGGVTERDVELAERISVLASDHDLTPQPTHVQVLEMALDTPASDSIRPFWATILAGADTGNDVVDPATELPPLWFQTTDSNAPDRQRFHLDITVPPEDADRRITAALAAGGRVVDDTHRPAFVVLADADGNNACICTELGRE